MDGVIIWHNPRCSKSREGLRILESLNLGADVFKYLEKDLRVDELRSLLKMLGMRPRELMRTKEKVYRELDLKNETDDEKLIAAMVDHPALIERPIVVKGDRAVVGRPPEKIREFLT